MAKKKKPHKPNDATIKLVTATLLLIVQILSLIEKIIDKLID